MLDEAIRNHLELKRRRGADPSEVAELEREALGEAEPDAADAGYHPAEQPDALDWRSAGIEAGSDRSDDVSTVTGDESRAGRARGEETMEIDVSSLFDESFDRRPHVGTR